LAPRHASRAIDSEQPQRRKWLMASRRLPHRLEIAKLSLKANITRRYLDVR
jgi:hypothetical protein